MSVDFWRASGWRLLERDSRGRHLPGDDWLRLWLQLPELVPPPEACQAEHALHAALLEAPRRPVTPVNLLRLRDPDARENWELFVAFRDHLLVSGTLEEAYLALFDRPAVPFPAMFLDRLVEAILRGVLEGCGDGLRLRAAECLFRPQRASVTGGTVLLADARTVEDHAANGGSALDRLVAESGLEARSLELDVLQEETAGSYFGRDTARDLALDIGFPHPGLDALCRVLEAWARHMLGVALRIQPVASISDERWRWHLGLDGEASTLLDRLWGGAALPEPELRRVLALFRIELRDPEAMAPGFEGTAVWSALAMDLRGGVRIKPQNLLVNLPLATAAFAGERW